MNICMYVYEYTRCMYRRIYTNYKRYIHTSNNRSYLLKFLTRAAMPTVLLEALHQQPLENTQRSPWWFSSLNACKAMASSKRDMFLNATGASCVM